MRHLELTELECKLMWLILDQRKDDRRLGLEIFPGSRAFDEAETSLFDKVYRAYRGIPEAA
jgi:hypothetical protein